MDTRMYRCAHASAVRTWTCARVRAWATHACTRACMGRARVYTHASAHMGFGARLPAWQNDFFDDTSARLTCLLLHPSLADPSTADGERGGGRAARLLIC
eukprot:364009-Chlamydomonas_euryale.AAC.11